MSNEKEVIRENPEGESGQAAKDQVLDEGIELDEKIEAAMEKIIRSAIADEDEEEESEAGPITESTDQEKTLENASAIEDDEDEDEDEPPAFLKEYKESLKAARENAKAAELQKEEKIDYPPEENEAGGSQQMKKQEEKKTEERKRLFAGKKSEKQIPRTARPQHIGFVTMEGNPQGFRKDPPSDQIKKKAVKGLKVTGLTVLLMTVAAGTAYAGVSYYYTDKFFNGTVINGIDCSGKTALQVEEELAKKIADYSIQVDSRDQEPQIINGDTINYRYVSDGSILDCLKSQKPYEWVRGYFEGKTYRVEEGVSYDKELLKTQVRELKCAQPENQVEPENAYVAFTDSQFEIIPETEGSTLDLKNAYKALDAAIAEGDAEIDFSNEPNAYVEAEITSENENLKNLMDTCNNFTKASITYTFGEQQVTLDGTIIKDWLQFDERNQLVQDDASLQQHVAEYVAQIAAQYDTVGTEREFYTTSGRVVYVYGWNYGWQINQAEETAQLMREVQSGAQVVREPIYSMTANSHGINDFGDTYIEVDMGEQHMYYYQYGDIIFDSDFVSGDINYSDRATPSGVYTLYFKTSPATLTGQINPETGEPEYQTEVTYWMPFNGGIGFHDADWQDYFGGDRFTYAGSHGCINLPYYAAAELYSIIQYDVPIICFY